MKKKKHKKKQKKKFNEEKKARLRTISSFVEITIEVIIKINDNNIDDNGVKKLKGKEMKMKLQIYVY